MHLINHIWNKYSNFKDLNDTFVGTPPFPMITLKDFLPDDFAQKMYQESLSIPKHHWSVFTRNGSHMEECVNLDLCPVATEFVNQIHSQKGMTWLTELTGIKCIIPDPYIIGGGYGKSYKGDILNIHTDFNWNDKLRLHRMASLIIYLNPTWKEEWGGALDFYDFNRSHVVSSVPCLFNTCHIWRYHKRGFHGYNNPLTCPDNQARIMFRLFFYVSNAEYDTSDRPHRSLYWYDSDTNEPYDIPTRK